MTLSAETFEREFQRWKQDAQAFAKDYPDKAHLFDFSSSRVADPYLERLFAGVAFLTADLNQSLKEQQHEFAETWLAQHWPSKLIDRPSMTILQLQPGLLNETLTLSAGTELGETQAFGPEKTPCVFLTMTEETLLPLVLKQVRRDKIQVADKEKDIGLLDFEWVGKDSVREEKNRDRIRLFLAGPLKDAFQLYHELLTQVESVYFDELYLGGQELLSPANLDWHTVDVLISPERRASFELFFDLQQFVEKFLFIDLDLKKLPKQELSSGKIIFQIRFIFNSALPTKNSDLTETIKINCLPVINAVKRPAEPFSVSDDFLDYPVRVDFDKPESQHALTLSRIQILSKEDTEMAYLMTEVPYGLDRQKTTYQTKIVKRKKSGNDLRLRFALKEGLQKAKVSLEVWACQAHYPAIYFRSGALLIGNSKVLGQALVFKNLMKPTEYFLQREPMAFEVFNLLPINLEALNKVDALKSVISAHGIFPGDEHFSRYIQSIKTIQTKIFDYLERGVMKHQCHCQIQIDETAFLNEGEILLWRNILQAFLAQQQPVNIPFSLNFNDLDA